MNDGLRFHPQVPYDLAEAVAWYEEISVDLANQLRAAIRVAFEKGAHASPGAWDRF